nr:retrovirus-related Pol polyprotein from transposon TNT 1-94 [Tanacetum cinerariifolium]
MIVPRRNDVYVLDMSSLTPNEACFFAKASDSVNWLWHKRISRLSFKNINKLAKQNKVLGLISLVYSKNKPCTTCDKGKHHRDSFKTKQNFSIMKCLHLLHMDLFGPVSPMSINHEKYTLVIVDEYSRYIWVYFLKKKSQAPEMIMSFIKMVENQNDVKVKQIRTDNMTKFRNHEIESFCDEKGISQNFSSPYTPEQNGVVERKNRTLIEAARTMLNRSALSKHFWTEAIRITCKFDAKDDDGYFLGYSFVSKAFRVFNTRRQQIKETYHVTCDESMEAIKFTHTSEDEIENHALEVIALNEPDIPHTKNTDDPTGNNTEVSGSITESLVPDVTQSHISNQASTSSHHVPQDRWSRDQHIKLVNIIGDPGEGMLTRSMAAKLLAASASELARMKAIRIFLAFTTYMNFKVYLMDVKSAFLNEKLKEEVYVKQPFGFESSEFPDYVYLKEMSPCPSDDKGISICQEQYTKNVLKKYEISDSSSLKTPMVPPNYLGPDLARKPVNETLYRGMIGSLMYLTATRHDI